MSQYHPATLHSQTNTAPQLTVFSWWNRKEGGREGGREEVRKGEREGGWGETPFVSNSMEPQCDKDFTHVWVHANILLRNNCIAYKKEGIVYCTTSHFQCFCAALCVCVCVCVCSHAHTTCVSLYYLTHCLVNQWKNTCMEYFIRQCDFLSDWLPC